MSYEGGEAGALVADFVEVAQDHFGLYASADRGRLNLNYVEMGGRVTSQRLATPQITSPRQALNFSATATEGQIVDPALFVAGDQRLPDLSFSGEVEAVAPCITIVVGQYGMGKTELAFRVCHSLQAIGGEAALPLPVHLGLCRQSRELLRDGMTQMDFFELLFCNVNHPEYSREEVRPALLDGLRSGHVLLMLDGLDELIGTGVELTQFIHGLVNLLTGDGRVDASELHFRVTVSVRHELLLAVAKPDASDLAEKLYEAGLPPIAQVYFLELGPLHNSHVMAYLASRVAGGSKVADLIVRDDRILEMLRRPLLLRIFCDLAGRPDVDVVALISRLGKHDGGPGELISTFVDSAVSDATLKSDQRVLTPFRWDRDRLAIKSLQLYEHGHSGLTVRDIRDILVSDSGDLNLGSVALSSQEILKGIHKCPFLVYEEGRSYDDPRSRIAFAHQIFFEYFVAVGMYMRSVLPDSSVFDELVLNVDMRKFLRRLIEGPGGSRTVWHDRTRKSYALEESDRAEWVGTHDFDELDRHRSLLLDSMTEPDLYIRDPRERERLERTVDWFLTEEHTFHPRYFTYNYEAVGVYVRHHDSLPHGGQVRRQFKPLLHERFHSVLAKLEQADVPIRDAWELVIERILSVALRLRYKWVRDDRAVGSAVQLVHTNATRNRVESILADIGRAVF